jgi:hypothetical protein
LSEQLFVFLQGLHDESIELLGDLKFDKRLERDGLLVGIYASMIELTGGVLLLVQGNRYAAVSAVFRTFLEAYVDFKNLFTDPSYAKNSYAQHHARWIKVLSPEVPNQYLSEIRAHPECQAALQRHQKEFAKLKKEGFSVLNVKERFQRAGMLEEYDSIYHFESDGSHNSLQAFINRHVELGEDTFGLALYKERSIEDYAARLDTTARLFMDATQNLHERLKSEHRARITAWRQKLDGLRVEHS